jgi:hypothetical protein
MEIEGLRYSAAQMLLEMVTEARHDIKKGMVSYGTEKDNAGALVDLDALEELARQALAMDRSRS